MQSERDVSLFEQQFVTATPRIGRCARVMDHDRTRCENCRSHGDRDRERTRTREVADAGKRDPVVAAQFGGLPRAAFAQLHAVRRLARLGGVDAVGELVLSQLIERERRERSRHDGRLGLGTQPACERCFR